MKSFAILLLVVVFTVSGCKKEPEVVTFTDNTIPEYTGISTLLVENYVNRIYIDLIGREPTDIEMDADVAALEAGGLSAGARIAVVDKLMTSTAPVTGDTTYAHAYSQKFYDDNKARFLEGISESDLYEQYFIYDYLATQDSTTGNLLVSQLERAEAEKLKKVINVKIQFRNGQLTVGELCRRMCFNVVYDDLHMNSFNFINASFDDLFFRYPTEAEMDEAFEPIEQVPSSEDPDLTGYLFGELFSTKAEYLQVLTGTDEFSEGMIRWAYQGLLSREPSTMEVYMALPVFNNGQNIRAIQKNILISDEYAGFN